MFFRKSNYRMEGYGFAEQSTQHPKNGGYGFWGSVVSDVGCVRSRNEDNFLFLNQVNAQCRDDCRLSASRESVAELWMLAGVFDGVSSSIQADVAAKEAADAFQRASALLRKEDQEEQADRVLRSEFRKVNAQISGKRQGATTATVLCANQRLFKLFHIGDSRAYLFRNGQLHQLTRDQTLAQLKLDAGLYDTLGSAVCADRHVLTDYVGRDQGGYPMETDWIPIQDRDLIILCSDGLYDLCTDAEITQILQQNRCPESQTQKMVDTARSKGGFDNITCMVIQFFKMEKGGI